MKVSTVMGAIAPLFFSCAPAPAPVAPPAPAAAAAPAIEEQINIRYYSIEGDNATAIRENINRQRQGITGGNYDAIAQWYVEWEYGYEPTGTGCTITELDVTLTGTITMPQLTRPLSDPQVRQRWEDYQRRLMAHEQQHIQHGREAARTVEAQLTGMTAPCEQFEAIANGYGNAAIAAANQRDLEYDQRTNHGATEGVRFP